MDQTSDDILNTAQFSFDGDFNDQLLEILTRVRLTRSEVENLQCLLDDVQHVLSYIWPGSEILPFGSIVTGLGIKTSDIDCFALLPPGSDRRPYGSNFVNLARNQLRRDPNRFTQLVAITSAKVPIVKFLHIPTGFNCDINFSSLSGVKNSKLIAFLLSMDSRALPLAIIVKYWSKVYNFTGTNLMANYALTMMVIFYLQVRSVLPSVVELQRHGKKQIVSDWNTAFDNNFIYIGNNSESLYQLLGGFFNYYHSFDFEQHMVSPFLGYPVSKKLIADLNTLPKEYSLYKENVINEICKPIRLDTSVCIQDPFEHGRNSSVGVFGKLFIKIKAHIEFAASAYNLKHKDEFLKELLTMDVQTVVHKPGNTKSRFVTKGKVVKNNQRLNNAQRKARQHYMRWNEHRQFNHRGFVGF